jgi:CTP:molybdopterin cytidylyltransferase MocA
MTVGLVLAGGAGRRMGGPKALLRDEAGTPWVVRTVRVLHEGGVHEVVVVVGAAADEVRAALLAAALPDDVVRLVVAEDWAEGMGASLRAGLVAVGDPDAVLVSLVDRPTSAPRWWPGSWPPGQGGRRWCGRRTTGSRGTRS